MVLSLNQPRVWGWFIHESFEEVIVLYLLDKSKDQIFAGWGFIEEEQGFEYDLRCMNSARNGLSSNERCLAVKELLDVDDVA